MVLVKRNQMLVGIAIIAVITLFVVGYQKRILLSRRLSTVSTQLMATPTPVEPTTIVIGTATSMDGKATVVLQRTADRESGMQTYAFIANNSSSPLFTKTLPPRTSMSLPANSWSPDNKYLFIGEENEQGEKNYFVLKASGEPFTNDQQYLDVGTLFAAKKLKYTLDEATGWASPTLLILTTKKAEGPESDRGNDGTPGPSFWFEVPSKAIMQLSR